MLKFLVSTAVIALAIVAPAHAGDLVNGLVEPRLSLPKSTNGQTRVALTLDACSGGTDMRILDTLVEQEVPATIFVTGKWLKRNPAALAILKQHPELFQVENHGAMHIPAVERPGRIYSIRTAGSTEAVSAEVQGGAQAILDAGLPKPMWFRGATAEYTRASIKQIEAMGYKIAGFSLNGDKGATLSSAITQSTYRRAKDGDVIISHINQPGREAGQGVAAGIQQLKLSGVTFVKLSDIDSHVHKDVAAEAGLEAPEATDTTDQLPDGPVAGVPASAVADPDAEAAPSKTIAPAPGAAAQQVEIQPQPSPTPSIVQPVPNAAEQQPAAAAQSTQGAPVNQPLPAEKPPAKSSIWRQYFGAN